MITNSTHFTFEAFVWFHNLKVPFYTALLLVYSISFTPFIVHSKSNPEEELATNEILSVFYRPVELCNIIQSRSMGNPVFLRRCLRYKIQEKHNKRIQMTVCIKKVTTNNGKSAFPMYVCLARRAPKSGISMDTVVYQIGRIFIFRNSGEVDLNSEVQVKFTLPELNKLAKEAKSDTIDLLFVSAATAEDSNLSNGVNSNLSPLDPNHLPLGESGEYCLLGTTHLESIYMAWNYLPSFRLGHRTEICTTLDLFPCILKSDFQNQGAKVSIQRPSNGKNMSISEIHISISAEEFGSKEKYSRHFLHLQ